MKKLSMVFAGVVMLLSSTAAFADDTTVTFGLRAWYNSWRESTDYLGGGSASQTNGSAIMVGPSLSIKLGKAFVGATYLTSVQDYESSDYLIPGDAMKFERHDLDVMLGLMFTRHFGMFVGYKTIDEPMKYTPAPGDPEQSYGTWKLKGPEIGILGNIPLGRSAAIYYNLAFLQMKQEFEVTGSPTVSSYDLTGLSGEIGLAFAFSESLFANVGVKALALTWDDDIGDTYTHIFYGPAVGLNYTF